MKNEAKNWKSSNKLYYCLAIQTNLSFGCEGISSKWQEYILRYTVNYSIIITYIFQWLLNLSELLHNCNTLFHLYVDVFLLFRRMCDSLKNAKLLGKSIASLKIVWIIRKWFNSKICLRRKEVVQDTTTAFKETLNHFSHLRS